MQGRFVFFFIERYIFHIQGDSGGPLYLARVEPNGEPKLDGSEPWYLLGLMSFGSRQCGAGKPGVYTRVESFLPWIKKKIGN